MSDSGDDTRALVSLEQNIANLEKSIRFNQNNSSATPGANGRNVRFNRYGHYPNPHYLSHLYLPWYL